jgi:hypothetical protein
MEEITAPDGMPIAIVIRKDFKKNGINFISKESFPLQLGINSYKKGEVVKPHIHLIKEVKINSCQEIVYVKTGSSLVNLYDEKKKLFKSLKLSSGDLIFFLSGGHGMEMVKDTVIMEVKQGPYMGKSQDKVMIE